jgi:hypothetical protein
VWRQRERKAVKLVAYHILMDRSGPDERASEATVVVDAPAGGTVRAVLHADATFLIALVAALALVVAGMALYVVHRAISKFK